MYVCMCVDMYVLYFSSIGKGTTFGIKRSYLTKNILFFKNPNQKATRQNVSLDVHGWLEEVASLIWAAPYEPIAG